MPDTETLLEVCVLGFAGALVAGGALLAFGRQSGRADDRRMHAESPPPAGSIGGERHRHVLDVASR